jgi:serine/threonine protein kinase
MGVVYRAHDTHLARSVAIKILPPERVADPERKRRFVREAKAASALTHPNIITIHDIDATVPSGSAYATPVDFIVMEHIDGRSLDQLISSGPLQSDEVLSYSVQIAAALAAAHAAGIVHRDIKPANIMLTGAGQVKVLDFGLAKLLDPTFSDPNAPTLTRTRTELGRILGTVAYMSPEQAEGKPVDARTDVFSFGIMLYEMLAQQRPFQGDSQLSILTAILHQDPPPLKKFRPNVPPALQRIAFRCLEKDRAARYPSAAELLKDLLACQSPPATFTLTAFLRNPRVAIPSLLLLLTLLAAGTWLGVRNYRQSWARDVTLPEISRLLEEENFDAAFRLGKQAEGYIPGDRQLLELQRHYEKGAFVQSTPTGADVYVKGYPNVGAYWIHIGKTPIENRPVPGSYLRWRVTKEGFEPVEGAFHPYFPIQFTLHPPKDAPSGMVSVPGGDFAFLGLRPVTLDHFWLDKYEVTNKQFKEFVDAGGYQKREYWKYAFVNSGRVLSWEEAMSEFRDATGRPGPATWQLGAYPEGRAEFPVNGVSWHEAAAYATFVGKDLPTTYHWYKAAEMRQFSDILRFSNFEGQGTTEVGSHQGLSPYGNHDMAGNVREWCSNPTHSTPESQRYILGASWNQAAYVFAHHAEAEHPFDRSVSNGFRLAKVDAPLSDALTAPIESVSRDYSKEKPVSDEVFAIYRSFFSYERKDLNARVEAVDDTAPHWRKETISFDAAYAGERVLAHLFIPRNIKSPYQTVVYFPSSLSLLARSSDELELRLMDFLPRIGRAVLYPRLQRNV